MPDDRPESPWRPWMLGLAFGAAFGFLLQKGGVAKHHVLVGALLLDDFTVFKVMASAIVVGMAGTLVLRSLGWVELQIKPTRYAANALGGLAFGAGFALLGYCPGTTAAALGQGNYDAWPGIAGMMAGSYAYALASAALGRTVETWGHRGKLTLPDRFGLPPWTVAAAVALTLLAGLALLERFEGP